MSRVSLPLIVGSFQAVVVVAALGVAPLVPPAEGRILLAPVVSQGAGTIVAMARDHDALIIGAGPWRGSIIVEGRRAALAGAMFHAGIMMIAAPANACGEGEPA